MLHVAEHLSMHRGLRLDGVLAALFFSQAAAEGAAVSEHCHFGLAEEHGATVDAAVKKVGAQPRGALRVAIMLLLTPFIGF
mmetsp:Transcript_36202/g.92162  ORF Transcript_36202/g.92162 Transcript_36202/m.92162 type:complete len:81 (+) Transcript_36202:3-245(+)